MLEVYTWEPNADSGKPLLCLKDKRVAFVHHHVAMGVRAVLARSPGVNPDGTIPMAPERGRWG